MNVEQVEPVGGTVEPTDLIGDARRILRAALVENGWTQARLAKQVGRTAASVSLIMSGKGRPSIATIDRMAAALHIRLVVQQVKQPSADGT